MKWIDQSGAAWLKLGCCVHPHAIIGKADDADDYICDIYMNCMNNDEHYLFRYKTKRIGKKAAENVFKE